MSIKGEINLWKAVTKGAIGGIGVGFTSWINMEIGGYSTQIMEPFWEKATRNTLINLPITTIGWSSDTVYNIIGKKKKWNK